MVVSVEDQALAAASASIIIIDAGGSSLMTVSTGFMKAAGVKRGWKGRLGWVSAASSAPLPNSLDR